MCGPGNPQRPLLAAMPKAVRPRKRTLIEKTVVEPQFPTTDQLDGRRVLHDRVSRQRQHDELSGWSRRATLTGVLWATRGQLLTQGAEHPRSPAILKTALSTKLPTMCSFNMLGKTNRYFNLRRELRHKRKQLQKMSFSRGEK